MSRRKPTWRTMTQYQIQCGSQVRHLIHEDAESDPKVRIKQMPQVMQWLDMGRTVEVRAVDQWTESTNELGEVLERSPAPAASWADKTWRVT